LGRVLAGAGPARQDRSDSPVEEHGAGARAHVDLALVCIPLVTSAPEPVLHSLNGSIVPHVLPVIVDLALVGFPLARMAAPWARRPRSCALIGA